MADISTEIAAIRNAVYGEEVRGSIADALEAMNENAEAAEEWATGNTGGTASATNNAKYYAEKAEEYAGTLVTDPTLTESGHAADAAVTGSYIRGLNGEVFSKVRDLDYANLKHGYIYSDGALYTENTAGGSSTTKARRLYTAFRVQSFSSRILASLSSSAYKFRAFFYSDPDSDHGTSQYYLGAVPATWTTGDLYLDPVQGVDLTYVRFVFARANETEEMDENDKSAIGEAFRICDSGIGADIDPTLTEAGFAADAAVTGDYIRGLNGSVYSRVRDINYENLKHGYISSSTGKLWLESTSGVNLETLAHRLYGPGSIPAFNKRIRVSLPNTAYKYRAYLYSDPDSSQGTGTYYLGAYPSTWTTGDLYLDPDPTYERTYVRLVFAHAVDTEDMVDEIDIPAIGESLRIYDADDYSDVLYGFGWRVNPWWTRGNRTERGVLSSSTSAIATTRGLYVGSNARVRIALADKYVARLFYSNSDGSEHTVEPTRFVASAKDGTYLVPGKYLYVVLRYYLGNSQYKNFTVWDAIADNAITIYLDTADDDVHDIPRSLGVINAVKRARQMTQLGFTTLAKYPYFTDGPDDTYVEDPEKIAAGTDVTGIPYSSTWTDAIFVPQGESFHSYMTSLLNENGYVYTRRRPEEDIRRHAMCFYGHVCSTFLSYAMGVEDTYVTTYQWPTYPGVSRNVDQSVYGLEVGDILDDWGSHVAMITDIVRSRRTGEIKYVAVAEAWRPLARERYLSPTTYYEEYGESAGYYSYRYSGINNVTYEADPWVNVGDESGTPQYSTHLSLRNGDKSNIGRYYHETPMSVMVDILSNTEGYTKYELSDYEDFSSSTQGTIRSSQTTIEIPYRAGKRYLRLTGPNLTPSESVSWICFDTSETFTPQGGGVLRCAFSMSASATGATIGQAVSVLVQVTSARMTRSTVRQGTPLTNEDRTRGYIDIDCGAGDVLASVFYRTEYGLIRSEQVPVTVL